MSEKYMERKKMRRERDEPAELRSRETPVEAAMRIRAEEERYAKDRIAEAQHDSPESRPEIEEAAEEYLEKVDQAEERLKEDVAAAENPAEGPIEHKRKFPEAASWPDDFPKKVEYAENVAELARMAGRGDAADEILNLALPGIWDALESGKAAKAEKNMARLMGWLTREFNGANAPEGAEPQEHAEAKRENKEREKEEDPAERRTKEKIYEEARSLRQSPLRQEFGKYWSGPQGYGPRLSAIEVEGFKRASPEFLTSELKGIERDIRRDENLAAESKLAFRELRKILKNHPPEAAATPEMRRELVRMQKETGLLSAAGDNYSPAELRGKIDNLAEELNGLLAGAPDKAAPEKAAEKAPEEKPEWETRRQELLDLIKESPLKKEFPDYWSDKMGEWKMAELRDGKMGERSIPRLQNILNELKKEEETAEEARRGLVRVVGFASAPPALGSLSSEQTRALANIDGLLTELKRKGKSLSPEGVRGQVGTMLRIMEESFPGGAPAAPEKKTETEEAIESIFAKERSKYPNIKLGNVLNLDLVAASPAEKKALPAKFERVLDALRNKLGDDFPKYKWNFEVWGPTEKMLAEDAIQVNFVHGNAENIAETVLRSIERDTEAAKQSAAKEAAPEKTEPEKAEEKEEEKEGAFAELEKELGEKRSAYVREYAALRKDLGNMKNADKLLSSLRFYSKAGTSGMEEMRRELKEVRHMSPAQIENAVRTLQAHREYLDARKALGQNIFDAKKKELAPGKNDKELEKALAEFKAGELFKKVVLDEDDLLRKLKTEEWPPEKAGLWKKMGRAIAENTAGVRQWYINQPKAVRWAISTAIATGVGIGTGGISTIGGMALFAGSTYARIGVRALAAGAVGNYVGKKLDKRTEVSFKKDMEELQKNFSLDSLNAIDNKYSEILRQRAKDKTIDSVWKLVFMAGAGYGAGVAWNAGAEMLGAGGTAEAAANHPAALRKMPKLSPEKPGAGAVAPKVDLAETSAAGAGGTAHGISGGGSAENLPVKPHGYQPEALKPAGKEWAEPRNLSPENLRPRGNFVEVNAGGNDSAWKMIDRELSKDFGDKYLKMDSARKTLFIDYVRQKLGTEVKDVMHKGDSLDMQKVLGDPAEVDKAWELVNKSTEAQLHSIRVHDKLLDNWAKTHRGEPLTTERADAIIAESHQAVPPESLPVGNHNLLPKGIMAPGVEDDSFMYEGAEGVNPLNHNLPAGEAIHSVPATGEVNPLNHNIPAGQAIESVPAGVNPLNHNLPAGRSPEEFYKPGPAEVNPLDHNLPGEIDMSDKGFVHGSSLEGSYLQKIIPHAIQEMKTLDPTMGEFSAIKDISVEEYMKHVPDTRELYMTPGMEDKLGLRQLTETLRMDNGVEKTVTISMNHIRLKEYMEGMRPELKGRVRFMSMGKFIELLERQKPSK